jgi:hypothetical protein
VPGQRVSGPDVSTVDKEQTVHSRTLKPACSVRSGPSTSLGPPKPSRGGSTIRAM